jgi:hypothetical protein
MKCFVNFLKKWLGGVRSMKLKRILKSPGKEKGMRKGKEQEREKSRKI